MKKFLAACLVASGALMISMPAAAEDIRGEVLEVQTAGGYSYLRIKTAAGETWAAVSQAAIKPGSQVVVSASTTMSNFESKALKRTFPSIAFGALAASGDAAAAANAPVTKAKDANGKTVVEILTKSDSLKDQTVAVSGRVVKINMGIRGKNWVHLQDGTGLPMDNTNDLIVVTGDVAKVGDVVKAVGVVRTNRDFGAGYSYKVLVEDAKLN